MDNMKIVLALENYSIYFFDTYYLCVPNNNSNFYHLFISFTSLDLKSLDEETVYKEIRKIGDSLSAVYSNFIYVLPVIKPEFLKEASLENDDKLYNKLLKKYIQPITSQVYNNFKLKKKYISPIIKFIKQNDVDKKIIDWISLKLGYDYVREIVFEENVSEQPKEEYINSPKEIITTDHKIDDIWIKKQENTISDTLKPAYSFGFSSLGFMLMILGIFLVLGTVIGYMIIK